MYHHHQQAQTDSAIRIFSPVILFHDATAECISDHQVIQLKKQKVNAMLKTNGQFWSNVIWSTRHQFSPPQTPPTSCSSNSSVISIEGQQKRWYHTPPEEDSDNSSLEEDEDDILEVVAVTNKKSKKTTTNTEVNRKRRGNLPKSVTAILRQWLVDHSKHPYPTEEEKRALKIKTNLTLNQISNWFINARRRILPLILASPDNTLLIKEEEKKPCLSPATKRKRIDSEDRKVKK